MEYMQLAKISSEGSFKLRTLVEGIYLNIDAFYMIFDQIHGTKSWLLIIKKNSVPVKFLL